MSPAPAIRRKALPWPKEFDGTRSEFPAWRQQILDKIAIDQDLIGGHRSQWYGINECLGKRPKLVVATYYASGGLDRMYNLADFLTYLGATYGDPDRARKAATKLYTLKQSP